MAFTIRPYHRLIAGCPVTYERLFEDGVGMVWDLVFGDWVGVLSDREATVRNPCFNTCRNSAVGARRILWG